MPSRALVIMVCGDGCEQVAIEVGVELLESTTRGIKVLGIDVEEGHRLGFIDV